ncbi:septal ring lytic transglycosylase RlpA family protein [Candidatus Peregrinibacteria bacterium]|nr:septal ring lytic transglycosylase RlpA family protein [Candidatus Peregrinibacteria bacterium]
MRLSHRSKYDVFLALRLLLGHAGSMHRVLTAALLLLLPFSAIASGNTISRRDGFLLIWQSIRRPVPENREKPFTDVSGGSRGFGEITYAKYRGIIDDPSSGSGQVPFYPDDPLTLQDALVWLLRTRSVAEPDTIQPQTLSGFLEKYPVANFTAENARMSLSEDDLMTTMRRLDAALAEEEHEVSLYAEKFHGHGTAFGETFDMHALTAAHRTFPQNTLVRVTNVANGKSVIVRINDRGPYVTGRDMDLSLASFTSIADRSKGKIQARFGRLGDAALVSGCGEEPRHQMRITRDTRLLPGIPHVFPLGDTLTLRGSKSFVVRSVRYPDGTVAAQQNWIVKDELFSFKPAVSGQYQFLLGTVRGNARTMTMKVVSCES